MNITKLLQDNIKSAMNIADNLINEGNLIENVYFDTGVNTDISAMASSDQISVIDKITKGELINGITLSQQINKFLNNQAVTQSDYLSTCNSIIYGTATGLSVEINDAVIEVSSRVKSLSESCVDLWNLSKKIINIYNANEISNIVAVLMDERIIFGSSMSRGDLNSAVTFLSQFINFIENAVVTTGDYKITISKWYIY